MIPDNPSNGNDIGYVKMKALERDLYRLLSSKLKEDPNYPKVSIEFVRLPKEFKDPCEAGKDRMKEILKSYRPEDGYTPERISELVEKENTNSAMRTYF